jgi:hypothetical protein
MAGVVGTVITFGVGLVLVGVARRRRAQEPTGA